jgi:2-polyprenyl-6-methoxyphenol hydroxylase-like FAD-dependent oxidoreductase
VEHSAKVVLAGAGIGGLTAAIALRRVGFEVVDLLRAHRDEAHEDVGNREPQYDPHGHLQCAPAALAEREPQRDDGRHRREEGMLVPQDC